MPEDLLARGSHRLAHADLPGSFGNRDQHDADDADSSHHQTHGGEGDHDHEEDAGELIEELDELAGLNDGEVVLLPRPEPSNGSHETDDLIPSLQRRVHGVRHHEDTQEHVVGLEPLEGGGVGKDGEVVDGLGEGLVSQVEDTDDDEELVDTSAARGHSNPLADGIELAEEGFGQGGRDDSHRPRLPHLGLGEVPARGEGADGVGHPSG